MSTASVSCKNCEYCNRAGDMERLVEVDSECDNVALKSPDIDHENFASEQRRVISGQKRCSSSSVPPGSQGA